MSAFQYRLLVLSVWLPRITIISILPSVPADHFAKYCVTAEFLRMCKQYLLLDIKNTRIPCRVASFLFICLGAYVSSRPVTPMFYKVSHPYLTLTLSDLPALLHPFNLRVSDFSTSFSPFVFLPLFIFYTFIPA